MSNTKLLERTQAKQNKANVHQKKKQGESSTNRRTHPRKYRGSFPLRLYLGGYVKKKSSYKLILRNIKTKKGVTV